MHIVASLCEATVTTALALAFRLLPIAMQESGGPVFDSHTNPESLQRDVTPSRVCFYLAFVLRKHNAQIHSCKNADHCSHPNFVFTPHTALSCSPQSLWMFTV